MGKAGRTLYRVFTSVLCLWACCVLAQSVSPELLSRLSQEAQTALADGRYADAAAAYEKLRTLSPQTAEVHANLGLIYFKEKKFDAAVAALRQALKLKPALPKIDALLAMS